MPEDTPRQTSNRLAAIRARADGQPGATLQDVNALMVHIERLALADGPKPLLLALMHCAMACEARGFDREGDQIVKVVVEIAAIHGEDLLTDQPGDGRSA